MLFKHNFFRFHLIDSFILLLGALILVYPQDAVPLPLLHASGSATFEGIKLRFLVIDRLGRYVLTRKAVMKILSAIFIFTIF